MINLLFVLLLKFFFYVPELLLVLGLVRSRWLRSRRKKFAYKMDANTSHAVCSLSAYPHLPVPSSVRLSAPPRLRPEFHYAPLRIDLRARGTARPANFLPLGRFAGIYCLDARANIRHHARVYQPRRKRSTRAISSYRSRESRLAVRSRVN